MKREELKMTIHLGRGYGQSFHTIRDKPVAGALREIVAILQEKYGYDIRKVNIRSKSLVVRRRKE